MGEYIPNNRNKSQALCPPMDTSTFLQTHRVFNLDEAVQALAPSGGRKATLERLKYAAARGKLKKLARGVYASVPPGVEPAKFQPDRFLAAAALRPDAIFSHHSALELLGAAHSEWRLCTAYSGRRSQRFDLDGLELRFLSYPQPLLRQKVQALLNGYVQSPAILEQIEDYIVPPGLGNKSGILGAIALAQEVASSE